MFSRTLLTSGLERIQCFLELCLPPSLGRRGNRLGIGRRNRNRPLTKEELRLARWMLEHGRPEAKEFLHQLESAEVTPWRCRCGCASITFQIKGHPEPPPGVLVLGHFLFGDSNRESGIFIFASCDLLSGIEVYGMAGNAPPFLPKPEELRPFN